MSVIILILIVVPSVELEPGEKPSIMNVDSIKYDYTSTARYQVNPGP